MQQIKRPGFDPWVRKISWRRKCNPLPYSYLENPMDRGAWWATVHVVAKSQTRLSTWSQHSEEGIIQWRKEGLFPLIPEVQSQSTTSSSIFKPERNASAHALLWIHWIINSGGGAQRCVLFMSLPGDCDVPQSLRTKMPMLALGSYSENW